jgi:hypothetical protein
VPASQLEHALAPVDENVPAAQAPVTDTPPKQKLAEGQGVGVEDPAETQNVPAPHLTHEADLEAGW